MSAQGLFYSAAFEHVTVTAVQDLFEVQSAADHVVKIHRIIITQEESVTSEQSGVSIQRATTGGSSGSLPSEVPLMKGSPAAGANIEANNTTQATTLTLLHREGFNWLNGWDYRPTPEERITLSASGILVVRLEKAPTSLEVSGTIIWEEIGG